MESKTRLTFLFFALIVISIPTSAKSSNSKILNICKLKTTFEDTKCKIEITSQDGSIKKRAKCETKISKSQKDGSIKKRAKCETKISKSQKDKKLVFHSLLPTNSECKGFVFNITLKVNLINRRRAKVVDVSWQRAEDETEKCNWNNIMENIPNNLKKQARFGKEQSAFWMKRVDGRKRIHELSIPGTHDSMAYKVKTLPYALVSNWHLCQSITLRSQLEKGVRFFDIRLGVKDRGYLGAYHGDGAKKGFLGSYFYQIMRDFNQFLTEHPSEAIIFRYKDETKKAGDFCGIFRRRVAKYKSKIWSSGGQWNHFGGKRRYYPTLNQIRGKILILDIEEKCNDWYGYHEHDLVELDNFQGGGYNPFTGGPGTSDMVDIFRRRKRRDTDEEEDPSHNETIPMENVSLQEGHSPSQETNVQGSTDYKYDEGLYSAESFPIIVDQTKEPSQIEIAEFKRGRTPNPKISENYVREMQRVVDSKGLCNINKTEKIFGIVAGLCLSGVINCGPVPQLTHASTAYKNELRNALDHAKGNSFKNNLITIFASATKFPTLDPKGFAEGVNQDLHRYLGFNWGRTGILVFDFITDWDPNMPFYVFHRNWQQNSCAKFYEHPDLKGDYISITAEVRLASHFGWDDRISSVWIAPGCRVYAYEHPYFGGKYFYNTKVFKKSGKFDDLSRWKWDNRISSMRCECYESYLPNI